MQVTYSAELIKKVVQSDVFLDYRRIIESGESRLDGITSIQVEFDEIIFLDELEISLAC